MLMLTCTSEPNELVIASHYRATLSSHKLRSYKHYKGKGSYCQLTLLRWEMLSLQLVYFNNFKKNIFSINI